MKKYNDINRDSGVDGYEAGDDYIVVLFKSGSAREYCYNYQITGQEHVERMKNLAVNGDGLNAYINKNVKNKFSWKK